MKKVDYEVMNTVYLVKTLSSGRKSTVCPVQITAIRGLSALFSEKKVDYLVTISVYPVINTV